MKRSVKGRKAGPDGRAAASERQAQRRRKKLVLISFPHSRPGRPKVLDDLVGAPV